jgi:hypothetical protein
LRWCGLLEAAALTLSYSFDGTIDVQIHKGKDDGRYYALDVARLMPPTASHGHVTLLFSSSSNVITGVLWAHVGSRWGQVHAVLVPHDVSKPLMQVWVHEEAGSWLKDALDKIQVSEEEVCFLRTNELLGVYGGPTSVSDHYMLSAHDRHV